MIDPKRPTTERPEAFPETRWSVVLRAGDSNGTISFDAVSELCRAYHSPLYVFARKRGHGIEDSQDLTQSFFQHVVDTDLFSKADQDRGRLRSFLLTSFQNFLKSEHAKSKAKKRGGDVEFINLDADSSESWYKSESTDDRSPQELFDLRWTLMMIDRVFGQMREAYTQSGDREALFDYLRDFVLENSKLKLAEIATRLGKKEASLKVTAQRFREQFRELFLEEIRSTLEDPYGGMLKEELQSIQEVLLSMRN